MPKFNNRSASENAGTVPSAVEVAESSSLSEWKDTTSVVPFSPAGNGALAAPEGSTSSPAIRYSPALHEVEGPLATVFLVGAGPGDPELLTVKALRILQSADIVFHDSLIGPEILDLVPASAQRVDVGKRAGFRLLTQSDINSLLVDSASKYKTVVRLKGGDPLLFGRAAEEIEALRAANIPFEIVPGISAAFGAAAAAKVSLTDRRLASHVLFTTFSRATESQFLPGIGFTTETTIVIYMPGPNYAEVSRWLQDAAVSPDTPVLVISKASHPDQSQHATNVAGLARLTPLPAPALFLVGRVAASAVDTATTVSAAHDFFHDSLGRTIPNARFS